MTSAVGLGKFARSMFNVFRYHQLFSTASAQFYIPASNVGAFQFLYIFTNTCYFHLCFYCSLQTGCEMESHHSFDVHFPDGWWYWASFPVLIGHLYIFDEVSIQIFAHFLNWVICLLLLSLRFLYSRYKFLIRYVISKYFLPFCELSFLRIYLHF